MVSILCTIAWAMLILLLLLSLTLLVGARQGEWVGHNNKLDLQPARQHDLFEVRIVCVCE